ncbi:hypothetical protein K1T71_000079 [Dendrolimus kikuchii]|uniref:Uncharacterized protein n=1 Tax=Dendrolimus kikuchii TaxID=765133 RepID=A0ACC1DID4_9NEOP|nr:hypothetical protein K1T71_000079 [Dendrolimus kikuchii]
MAQRPAAPPGLLLARAAAATLLSSHVSPAPSALCHLASFYADAALNTFLDFLSFHNVCQIARARIAVTAARPCGTAAGRRIAHRALLPGCATSTALYSNHSPVCSARDRRCARQQLYNTLFN